MLVRDLLKHYDDDILWFSISKNGKVIEESRVDDIFTSEKCWNLNGYIIGKYGDYPIKTFNFGEYELWGLILNIQVDA